MWAEDSWHVKKILSKTALIVSPGVLIGTLSWYKTGIIPSDNEALVGNWKRHNNYNNWKFTVTATQYPEGPVRRDLSKAWINVQPLYFQCLQIKFPFKIKVVGLDEIKGTRGKCLKLVLI